MQVDGVGWLSIAVVYSKGNPACLNLGKGTRQPGTMLGCSLTVTPTEGFSDQFVVLAEREQDKLSLTVTSNTHGRHLLQVASAPPLQVSEPYSIHKASISLTVTLEVYHKREQCKRESIPTRQGKDGIR